MMEGVGLYHKHMSIGTAAMTQNILHNFSQIKISQKMQITFSSTLYQAYRFYLKDGLYVEDLSVLSAFLMMQYVALDMNS